MDNQKITVGFRYVNEFNDKFESESEFAIIGDVSPGELVEIGEKFNTFLKQVGYVRYNDLIFMEDVNEEEYDALQNFLDEYRSDSKKRG